MPIHAPSVARHGAVALPGLGLALLLALAPHVEAGAADGPSHDGAHPARFAAGDGPRREGDTWHLLDGARTPGQSNAVAWDASSDGAHESLTLRAGLRIEEGGDGGALLLLATEHFGERGPAPFLADWTAPSLAGSFAVGLDVHDPPTDEPFGPLGNVLGLPEREVSLHWDGRELVKRVAPEEFRGSWVDLELTLVHVTGGAEVSLRLGDALVYERFFVPDLQPYRLRLAAGAGTRADVSTTFALRAPTLELGEPAAPRRPPLHVSLFHHVLTDNSTTSYEAEVDLPPLDWALGRTLLTLSIHDAGDSWDEWDRNGDLFVQDDEGTWRVLTPFITSYRTECHWVVDVSDFRPWLSGRRRFRIAAGTTFYKNRGYQMSAALDFHHDLPGDDPARPVPTRVLTLWDGRANHGPADNHFQDFYEPLEVELPDDLAGARFVQFTTGHSQVGEFTPAERSLVVDPDIAGDGKPLRVDHTLWKTDCYLNPNRPQFGTWKYPRAGWAPGDVVAPWVVDLSDTLAAGATARFRFEPRPYEFPEGRRPSDGDIAAANHVVRTRLVLDAVPAGRVRAPVLRVTGVSGGSNAATAGIQVGDYLAAYDGRPIDSVPDLSAAKAAAQEAGRERVAVVVWRGAERLDLELDAGQLGVNLAAR